ncbi:hypothetical protein BJX66DRAFT_348146 [Aspergillus keveii]|uniref:chitinase n=1 Tax=Aspergillus keveii TaxID=714993 RepID=A0ABR4FN28_9EURO
MALIRTSLWISLLLVAAPVYALQAEPPELHRRAECETTQVQAGDGCWALADRCGITQAQLLEYNPQANFCETLDIDQWVCCSPGDLPDFTPQPGQDGSCYAYTIESGAGCWDIAEAHYITTDDIDDFNANTWGWAGCSALQPGQRICLSEGDPPMPAPLDNAVCGPQVPGTERPTDGTELKDLNPCPLDVCCNVWGQCGITDDFCVEAPADTGAPGTSQPGANGCVSNCGMEITNNNAPPASFAHVAYFEAWNRERPCLHMDVTEIDTQKYTHIHFAFADITPDFQVDVSKVQAQFNMMKTMTGIKRIISFGGWAFSTEAPTYTIFREGVTAANRETFAQAVVDFVNAHGLEGVDFDWEYPSAPDIPGIPPGIKEEGENYLEFLILVKSLLPNKSVSIAAPASYWYLRGFPMKEIGEVVDYIIYMTYDLHGQWDYGNEWANPGCPGGNCLRSHINITETTTALALITKAGVPSWKVFVGIASYGRSFHMAEAGCTGPMCRFTGSFSVSDATHGICTGTGGYISSAEIRDILRQGRQGTRSVQSWHDHTSNSDIVVYDTLEWVAWMADATKSSRISWVQGMNFGGVSDWAVDLDGEAGTGGSLDYRSPISATVIPFPATTVGATQTFTIGGPVAANVEAQPNAGEQNSPKGPGADRCEMCDLARLITSTCCGIGGSVSNPIEISPNVPLARGLILPGGFRVNQDVYDSSNIKWSAGQTIPWEIIIPRGTRFPFPFEIPAGLELSDTASDSYTEDEDDGGADGVLYIISDFWERPHTVSCFFPCTLMFPPIATTSTWTPGTFVTSHDGETATVSPPIQTTQKIRISKETVESNTGSPPTKTIDPVPAPTPLCIKLTIPILGDIQFGLFPDVTIIPVPPGEDQEDSEEEEEEEEDDMSCALMPPPADPDGDYNPIDNGDDAPYNPDFDVRPTSGPGSGQDTPNGAGVGSPITTIITVTAPPPPPPTVTITVTVPAPPPPPPIPSPEPDPEPPRPNPDTEESRCFSRPNREVLGGTVQDALDNFCEWADGRTIRDNDFLQVRAPGDFLSNVIVGVVGKNNCEFTIEEDDCKRILNKVVGCRPGGSLLRIGGEVESNCALWTLDPVENLHGDCIPIPIFDAVCQLLDIFAP